MVPAILIYLLKANIALTLFFLAYRFGLRRLTFYTGNRIFLLTGIAFSSLFPLISIDAFINRHEMLAGNVLTYVPDLAAWQAPVPVFTVWTLLVYLFWTGVSLMTIRFGIQLFSLWKIHRHSQPAKIDHTPVHLLQEPVNPFSFFRNIYINPSLHQPEELPAILRHEMVHVGQWHSVDVLLGELNNIFYWFNPGAWLMKTAIRENLEFITDRHLLKQGIDKTAYQYNLIKVSGVPYATAIANNFNFSHLKNRIIMMNSKKSSRYQVARYLVLGLLVGGTVLSLNYTKATSVVVLASAKDTIPPPPPPSPKVPPPPAPPKDAKLPPPPPAPPKDAKLPPPPPQNMLSLHLDDPSKEPLYVLDGKIVPSIEYISPDGIASVDVLKGESGVALYGERGKNGVVKITTKKGAIAAVPVVLSDVKQVNVTDTSRNGLRINIRDPKSKTQGIPGNTLVLVDGKKVTQEEATSIPADKIQSMSVYKGGKTTMYKGTPQPNGVIAITLKGSPGATTGNAKDTGSVIHVYGGNAATSGVTTVTADTIFVK